MMLTVTAMLIVAFWVGASCGMALGCLLMSSILLARHSNAKAKSERERRQDVSTETTELPVHPLVSSIAGERVLELAPGPDALSTLYRTESGWWTLDNVFTREPERRW